MCILLKFKLWVFNFKCEVVVFWFVVYDFWVLWYVKVVVVIVVVYVLLLIDLILDFILVFGYFDDLILVLFGIFVVVSLIFFDVMCDFWVLVMV